MPIQPELRHFYRTPAWFAARAAVRERAGDRCERCKCRNGEWVVRIDAIGRVWPGAKASVIVTQKDAEGLMARGEHVTLIQCGWCHRNNVAGDDRPENLAWWCRGCHLKFDAPFHKRTRQTRRDLERPILALTAL